jgi:hypothetical protein
MTSNTSKSRAIVGELSLDLGDGLVLHDSTDVGLARQWAAHVRGERWESMRWQDQNDDVAGALAALRAAHASDGEVEL